MKHETSGKESYIHQLDLTVNETPPTLGLPYVLLPATAKVRIISLFAQCTWTVQPSPLEIRLTVDGQTLLFSVSNPVTATPYVAYIDAVQADNASFLIAYGQVDEYRAGRGFLLEGQNVYAEVEISGGTVQNLLARIKYALLRP